MQFQTISEIMVRDHDKIINLLIDFEKSIVQDKKTMMKAFNEFVWELEKHLFTEEKAIFISYEPKDETEGYAMVPRLMSEHDEIFDRIKTMKKSIKKNKDFDFTGFRELLKKHKYFEDETVYPLFDQELDETTKKMIIKRIVEVKLMDSSIINIRVKCSECGKKLGILEGYYNPKVRRRWLFCSECYDKIERKGSPILKKIK